MANGGLFKPVDGSPPKFAAETMIEISVLIPTKNGGNTFEACLARVYTQRGVAPFEVIVVDSGSTDCTLKVARRYPTRLEQIPPEAFHHARTRNYAASLSKGKILVFLSQDAVPASETWLGSLVADFEDSSVGAVYGRQLPHPGSTLERQDMLDVLYGREKIVKDLTRRKELGYRCYMLSNVNSAIRKDVWQKAPFPEDMKVFEDIGIAKRILDQGWKIVYEPDAVVHHSHNHTARGLFKRYFDMGVTWKLLDIWNSDTRHAMRGEMKNLIRRKVNRFGVKGNRKTISASLGHDLAKAVGLSLGINERFLPLALKRRLSAYGLFDEI